MYWSTIIITTTKAVCHHPHSRLSQCTTSLPPHAYKASAGDIVFDFCFLAQFGLGLRHYTYHMFRIQNSRWMWMTAKLSTLLLVNVFVLFALGRNNEVYRTKNLHDLGKRRKGTTVFREGKEMTYMLGTDRKRTRVSRLWTSLGSLSRRLGCLT